MKINILNDAQSEKELTIMHINKSISDLFYADNDTSRKIQEHLIYTITLALKEGDITEKQYIDIRDFVFREREKEFDYNA